MSLKYKHLVDSDLSSSKNLLAKLMAFEDLSVVRDPGVSEPSFDKEKRIITIPLWNEMSDHLSSMFIAEFVGYALFSPKIDPEKLLAGKKDFYKDIVEIVEKAWIRKKILRRFPGCFENFKEGSRELFLKGFFNKGWEIPFDERKSLLNRFILRTRLSPYLPEHYIPLDDEEQALFYAIEESESWEDVLLTSDEIYEFLLEHVDPDESEKEERDGDPGEGKNSSAEGNPGKGDPQSGSGGGGSGGGKVSLTDFHRDLEDKNKDAQKDESEAERRRPPPPDSFDINDEIDISDLSATPYLCHYEECFLDLRERFYSHIPPVAKTALGEDLRNFGERTKKVVSHMVQEFLLKKAAKESFRTKIAKTGLLDTNALWKYKISDDVFKTVEVKNRGKSHGVLLFLDMSGSMASIFTPSLLQILNLVQFCKAVTIPFEVYGFTSNGPVQQYVHPENDIYLSERNHSADNFFDIQFCRAVTLNHYFSSRMNIAEITAATQALYCYGKTIELLMKEEMVPEAGLHTLSGTPLDACLLLSKDLFWDFKRRNGVDIIHSIYVSDGGNELPLFTRGPQKVRFCKLKNGPFRYEYTGSPLERTKKVVEIVKDETNSRVLNFFLSSSSFNMENSPEFFYLSDEEKEDKRIAFKKEGFVEISSSYDKMFIMNPTLLSLDGDDDYLQMKARPLLRSFILEISEA